MKFPFDESKLEEELSEIASLLKLRVEGNVSLLPSFLSLFFSWKIIYLEPLNFRANFPPLSNFRILSL